MHAGSPSLLLLPALALLALFAQARVPSVDIDTADLSGFEALTLQGAASGDFLGHSVSAAGDVNGDGFADVIVGAYLADPNGRSMAGVAYVILGTDTGFATVDLASFVSGDSTGFIIWGAATRYFLGYSVSGAGDVNSDGFADVIVGAPFADLDGRSGAGVAYLLFGMASGFTTLDLLGFVSGDSTGFIIWA
ncbi:hypothetical protein B484DRAFT_439052, partial [Ochromonadaceae sp. CCMP2298]